MSGLVVVATTRSNVLRIGGIMKLDVLSAWELRRRECERVPVRGHRHPMRVGRPEVHDPVAAPANVPLMGNIMPAGCRFARITANGCGCAGAVVGGVAVVVAARRRAPATFC
jgi:hypothetical protein